MSLKISSNSIKYVNNKNIVVDMLMAYIKAFHIKPAMVDITQFEWLMCEHPLSDTNKSLTPNIVLRNPSKYKKYYKAITNPDKQPIIMSEGIIIIGEMRIISSLYKGMQKLPIYEIDGKTLSKCLVDDNVSLETILNQFLLIKD